MELLTIHNLSFTYPGQSVPALGGIELTVEQGEFLTVCGPSGCGKTTLLRLLKQELAPNGQQGGSILFRGHPLAQLSRREQASAIGFVLQSPDNQVVTDKVWHELAFGLESLGMPQDMVRRRVAETAAFFGIQGWFYRDVSTLSGGQKQIMNLASILSMGPELLILDEPTSQLDPTAAADFLDALARVNRELGVTIILCEHRLEHAFALCSRVAVLDRGQVLCTGTPAQIGAELKALHHPMSSAMPVPMEVYAAVENDLPCPVSTAQGRSWLVSFAQNHPIAPVPVRPDPAPSGQPLVEAQSVWYRYAQDTPWVVREFSFRLYAGQCVAILGQNGAGKTTALKLLAGLIRPAKGSVRIHGSMAALPQNPQTLFLQKTVALDLLDALRDADLPRTAKMERVRDVVSLCRLEGLEERHPYDLSGGEQQRAALAKVLLTEPRCLLLDEPTKGMDGAMKRVFAAILRDLTASGTGILMVSHDTEFCARYADACCLFFDGSASVPTGPQTFFSENLFYTTCASRMSRGLLEHAVTPEDLILACGGTPIEPPPPRRLDSVWQAREVNQHKKALPLWRKLLTWFSAGLALSGCIPAVRLLSLPDAVPQWLTYALLFAGLLGLSAATWQPHPAPPAPLLQQPLGRGTWLALICTLLLIPATILFGPKVFSLFGRRVYYFISLLILIEAMLPFLLLFEGRKPQARELVLLASLCALGVASRAAFFMFPQFKPVAALVIVSAMAFRAETGFLVGALTMLLSNMLFGQGPHTPWQMCAMGLVGFLAGLLARAGLLRRSRISLSVYGFLSVLLIYGFIMNASSAFQLQSVPTLQSILAYCATGFPMDLVHAGGTAFFLWFAGLPVLDKLDRIKDKYGVVI